MNVRFSLKKSCNKKKLEAGNWIRGEEAGKQRTEADNGRNQKRSFDWIRMTASQPFALSQNRVSGTLASNVQPPNMQDSPGFHSIYPHVY